MGAPIAYRDLSVQDLQRPCRLPRRRAAKAKPPPSCGSELVAHDVEPQTLTAVAAYSANVQGLVSFQLPSSFNEQTRCSTHLRSTAWMPPPAKPRLLMLRDRPIPVRYGSWSPSRRTSGAAHRLGFALRRGLVLGRRMVEAQVLPCWQKRVPIGVRSALRKAQTSTP
jgi:hypothetical protein